MSQEGTSVIPSNPSGDDIHAVLGTQSCEEIAATFALIGDKWSMMIVICLAAGPCRFNNLKRQIGGITQRMLTLTLRKLERHGLVSRTVHSTVPPTVEYALTPLGASLQQPIQSLGLWVLENLQDMKRAQNDFDAGIPKST
ncbi:winged helix-turn-helix transcriptional regulator [Thioclava sp. GXIMD4215]|uniref:winged helix-turn-helix transcriptional regulator n=1 Tax=Thioclava sp. GXIMD4215 TaxID=3131928 RepID=UPI003248E815